MRDLVILFAMSLAMGGALLFLNLKVRSSAAKLLSYTSMWGSVALAAWTLIRVARKVG